MPPVEVIELQVCAEYLFGRTETTAGCTELFEHPVCRFGIESFHRIGEDVYASAGLQQTGRGVFYANLRHHPIHNVAPRTEFT